MAYIDLSEPDEGVTFWKWFPVWTAAALLYAAAVHTQVGVPFPYAFATSAVYYYSLALFMVPVSRWAERLMRRQPPMAVMLAAHIAVGVLVVAAWQTLLVGYYFVALGSGFWDLVYARNWMFQLLYAVAIYATALSVTLTSQSWRREADLIVAARDAELTAIKAQFQPHFVLNSLNSLLALIDVNPALARTMVVRLSDLMKAVFERIDVPRVPLERELDLVRAYLDVERIRLGPRLSVSYEIDDTARGVLVPPFLLQPLVENAVKHGVAPYAEPGWVRVTASVEGERVQVTVSDSGPPPRSSASAPANHVLPITSSGRGLHITRRRLQTVYGDGGSMNITREGAGWPCAWISRWRRPVPREALRLLIADDEPLSRDLLRRYAGSVPGLELVCECATGDEVAKGLVHDRPDVALLDIRMPGADIFDVLSGVASSAPLPSVIFTTAYDSYAVRAFELNAIDYLVRPYSAGRFAEAIRRVRDRLAERRTNDGLVRALRDLGPRPDRLLVPDGRRMVPVQVADISWIKAESDYARVFAGGRGYLVGRSLKELEHRLDPTQFVRIHRSAIVQTSHIREVRAQGSSRYRVILSDGTEVIVSRSRAPELRKWML